MGKSTGDKNQEKLKEVYFSKKGGGKKKTKLIGTAEATVNAKLGERCPLEGREVSPGREALRGKE